MDHSLLTRLRRRGGQIGQLVAVLFVLQAVAAVLDADLVARDPLSRYIALSLCAPSGGEGPVSSAGAGHICCPPGATCAVSACCGAGASVAPAPRPAALAAGPSAEAAVPRLAAGFLWPQPTGPPAGPAA